jgi:hypothetical protein
VGVYRVITKAFHTQALSPKGFGCISLLAGLCLTACNVGDGSGLAGGPIFIEDCNGERCPGAKNLGTRAEPKTFQLNPHFFAGEPIEDLRDGARQNRLILRLQHRGGRVEDSNTLYFDIVNLYEVARCIRGRIVVAADGTRTPDYDPAICQPPRIRIGHRDVIRASFVPAEACCRDMVAVGVSCLKAGVCDDSAAWESWIEFVAFGSAVSSETDPTKRSPIGRGFKVDFGQRIWAKGFQLTIEDARVLGREDAPPTSLQGQIGGELSGWFDFDMERSRAAQTFP